MDQHKQPQRTCLFCQKEFGYSRSNRSNKYCSRKCSSVGVGLRRRLDNNGTKICLSCKKTKPFLDFHRKNRPSIDGLVGSGNFASHCKACRNERGKAYHNAYMKDKQSEYYKKRHAKNPAHKILSRCKSRAKELGLPFDLVMEDIQIPEKCPVLGIAISVGETCFHDGSPSIDRKIPALGYVKSNIEIISQRANRIKNDASIEELERIVRWMKK